MAIAEEGRISKGADSINLPHIVIVGAGFAGLACAKALGDQPIRVTVVDRRNYHLFVPLLYQVAAAALSPAEIAEPTRKILSRFKNIDVMLGEVCGVDANARRVQLEDERFIPYDYLVLATGSEYNYFGHEQWEQIAPGLKTIADARTIRMRVLMGFELAETELDSERQQRLTTTVIVGGGPTGVELAGALAELARWSLQHDFHRIDPASARIVLIEAGPHILSSFADELGNYARHKLEQLGVEIHTGEAVCEVCPEGVLTGKRCIPAHTIVWAAGIRASPASQWLGIASDRLGRILVNNDLSVQGCERIYALGDTALLRDEDGEELPALAQVARQQGMHLGRALAAHILAQRSLPAFVFQNRGTTAIVGRSAAVFEFGKYRLKGWLAWLLWGLVHIYLLIGFEKRLLVGVQWLWRWLTYQSGARLIIEPSSRNFRDGAQMDA